MAQPALTEIATRNAVLMERLKSGEVRKFAAFYRQIDKSIRERLSGDELTGYQRARLAALLVAVERDLAAILSGFAGQLTLDLQDVAAAQAGFEARALGVVVPDFDAVTPAPVQVWAAITAAPMSVRGAGGGKLLAPFIADWSKSAVDSVVGKIRQGVFEGQTNAQIVKAIRGTVAANYADGTLAQVNRHAQAIVRTSVQHVSSVARLETWGANADILAGYQWVSTLDGRTTDQCMALDGKVFQTGKGPLPPIHINCRSTPAPVLSDEFAFLSEGEQRSSVNGPVDGKTTYYEWLKTQPAGFQDAALGKSRATLFRDGGLSAERFAAMQLDRTFQPLTLKEMQALEPLAFARAGVKP